MNYIDVKNFRKYEQLFGDNGPAKIGHVNAVIKALNELAPSYKYLGNSSAVSSIDWAQASVQELNLNNNPTLTFSNGILGQTSTLLLKQNQVGQKTVTWPANVLWSGGIAPSLISVPSVVVDSGLTVGSGFSGFVGNIKVQPDGKILVVGSFSNYNGNITPGIVRLNTDGSYDNTFNVGSGTNAGVRGLALQSDGKVIINGYFTSYDGNSCNFIARLNSDGSYDNTFNIGTGFNNAGRNLILQPDGKIIVVGDFGDYNGTPAGYIVRLNSDGTIDGSFTTGIGFNNSPQTLILQSDLKMVIVGGFNDYNGTSCNGIVRLNPDGTPDTTYITNTGTGFPGGTYDMDIQTDGKIIVVGSFNQYNGSFIGNNIVRINTDGTYDATLVTGGGFSTQVGAVKIDSAGKILVGGYFNNYNGDTANRFIRLNSDGSVDSSFNIGNGFNDGVTAITIQSDGKILTGGQFTSFNGTSRVRFARLQIITPSDSYSKFTFDYNGTYYIGSY